MKYVKISLIFFLFLAFGLFLDVIFNSEYKWGANITIGLIFTPIWIYLHKELKNKK